MTEPRQAHRLHILKVALDVPLDGVFDYLSEAPVQIGQRVVVPFGPRRQVGIVVDLADASDVAPAKLKSIIQYFDQEPVLDGEFFSLLKFCADYYQYPYGQALLSALPARLRQTEPARARQQFCYWLNSAGQAADISAIPVRQAVQRRIFAALRAHGRLNEAELAELSPGWRKGLAALRERGWIEEEQVYAGLGSTLHASSVQPELNEEQVLAVQSILQYRDTFRPWLLHGITGSGKTEVYIRLLQAVLEGNQDQALVLVPEINLTPQLEARFRTRLPQFPLVTLHSNLSESERLQNWRLAQTGAARIVIGTRLSVFTPLPGLKFMIVDEEHDTSYKQQDGMRYHARDVALVRAQRRNIPIVLGSATPALETWHNARNGRYGLLTLQQRAVSQSQLPQVNCVDVSRVQMQEGLSPQLLKALKVRLERGEQSLLFINRRGYAPVLLCNACHWIAPCMRCSSRLVVHLRQGFLRCHHCGHEQNIVRQCPSCGNADLHPTGNGTQRLEETLTRLLPEARVLRVDRDSTRRKHALSEMLSAVHVGEVDILVGTQMLAKGHDFPNLTLVGVLDTDSALFSPDFRAAERLFAQLMQVAGRAGRADKPGEVLIQTSFPEHQLFNALRVQDFAAYAASLLQEREVAQFPPCEFLALIKAEANEYGPVQRFLQFAADSARALGTDALVYDPVRPQMERLKGMERGQLLFQAATRQTLQIVLRQLTPQLRAHPLSNKIRWAVDVDPQEF
ncbi:primosomal protein N' [Methylobacillus flagellatus]|uniref:Replication restart protein PriA n=1 Tax=Methylobacillus flagellatus (strain ATCC 51484 / DSM 6875 / VKM B-1610 / KT) TaxID=265072 RepID=Q1GXV2_METFK|nr:primosomal protein N' [Methylobacillus flagellatus]ABE50935.1 replication restart DNA helicase PriA [Methylobacillus flagellatus KT]